MSRLKQILQASVEQHSSKDPTDPLEDYLEDRVAMEDLEHTMFLWSSLEDLEQSLTDVESTIASSRDQGTLEPDQVAQQLTVVNQVRTVMDGVTPDTVSIESLSQIQDLVTISLEASDNSTGYLRRIWDTFLALLKAIWEGIQAVLRWIGGANKKSKEMRAEVSKEIREDVDKAKSATEEEKERAAVKVARTQEVQERIRESEKKMDETVKAMEKADKSDDMRKMFRELIQEVQEEERRNRRDDVPLQEPPKGDWKVERQKRWDAETDEDYVRLRELRKELHGSLAKTPKTEKAVNRATSATKQYVDAIKLIETEFFKYEGREDRLEKRVSHIDSAVAWYNKQMKSMEKAIQSLKPGGATHKRVQDFIQFAREETKEMVQDAQTIRRFLKVGFESRQEIRQMLKEASKELGSDKSGKTA